MSGDLIIKKCAVENIEGAYKIEAENFSEPWGKKSFVEVFDNPTINFIVLCKDERVIGFAMGQLIVDEYHILNIAVKKSEQNKKYGRHLFTVLLNEGLKRDGKHFFLEVRLSNERAIKLYEKYFFLEIFQRKNYYSNPSEHASVMYASSEEIALAINKYFGNINIELEGNLKCLG